MLFFLIVIAIVVALLLLLALPKSDVRSFLDIHPYYSKNPLTPTEAVFYELLVHALPDHVVLAQVQLSRFIGVDSHKARGNFYRWFNPIAQQSVDYLICEKNFKVVAAVELDDKTHDTEDAIRRDNKKNRNIAAAGIRLIRWHAELLPATEEIQQKVLSEQHTEVGAVPDGSGAFIPTPVWAGLTPIAEQPNLLTIIGAKAAMLLLFVGFMAWALRGLLDSASHLIPQAVPVVSASGAPHDKVAVLAQGQEMQRQLQELQRQEAHLRQLQEEKAKIDAILLASREAALKEDLWAWYFQKSAHCEANYDSDCANAFIRAKQKFEAQWNAGKRDKGSFVR